VLKAEAGATSDNQITYSILDPIARSLLLRNSLMGAGIVRDAQGAAADEFVTDSGQACLRNPQLESKVPANLVQHQAWCPKTSDPVYE
jgi:hypothetical protein